MRSVRLFLLCFITIVVAVLAVVAGPPAVFLTTVWWKDQSAPLPAEGAGRGDASRLANSQAAEVLTIASDPDAAEKQVADLVLRAGREGRKISIVGARHSMGGHTLYPSGIALDMLAFRGLSLDAERKILMAGAGARWALVRAGRR